MISCALIQQPTDVKVWNGPYIKRGLPKDPWGNDYKYVSPGTHGAFDIVSLGNDGKEGGEGEAKDVTNWE